MCVWCVCVRACVCEKDLFIGPVTNVIEGVSDKRRQVPFENLGGQIAGIKTEFRDIIELLWYLLKN